MKDSDIHLGEETEVSLKTCKHKRLKEGGKKRTERTRQDKEERDETSGTQRCRSI